MPDNKVDVWKVDALEDPPGAYRVTRPDGTTETIFGMDAADALDHARLNWEPGERVQLPTYGPLSSEFMSIGDATKLVIQKAVTGMAEVELANVIAALDKQGYVVTKKDDPAKEVEAVSDEMVERALAATPNYHGLAWQALSLCRSKLKAAEAALSTSSGSAALPDPCSLSMKDGVVQAAYNTDEEAQAVYDFLALQASSGSAAPVAE